MSFPPFPPPPGFICLCAPGRLLHRVRQALVTFFCGRPVSERRAEELPWLLERLQDWSALKAVLLDLTMFTHLYVVLLSIAPCHVLLSMSSTPVLATLDCRVLRGIV